MNVTKASVHPQGTVRKTPIEDRNINVTITYLLLARIHLNELKNKGELRIRDMVRPASSITPG